MAETVVIGRRYNGPPQSAHGGYTCGLLARRFDAPAAEVTLRSPPPLERELALERSDGAGVELRDGELLVAEGRPLDGLELTLPEPVDIAAAARAREASPLHEDHPFPTCFVCGPQREVGDGMRVTCGPVEGRDLVASPWEIGETLALEGDALAPEIVWAALDCPSGLAVMQATDPVVAMLGRLTARIDASIASGQSCVAVGWPIDRDGRKRYTGSAIFSAEGDLLACAKAVWIELKQQP